jgi:hypothetical protein
MLTTKIDLLMKKLEDSRLHHLKMVDNCMTCEECEETGHMGVNGPTVHHVVNFAGNSNNGFCSNQGFNSGWNKPNFPFDNCQQGSNELVFNRNEPSLRDIVRDRLKINKDFGKRIHATDKLLENMSSNMDNFIIAMQN